MLVHPDYSGTGPAWQHYADLLKDVREMGEYWHALPREVASWWKARSSRKEDLYQTFSLGKLMLEEDEIRIETPLKLFREPVCL